MGVRGYEPMYRGCTFSGENPVMIDKDGAILKSLFKLINILTGQGAKVIIIEALMYSKLRKYYSDRLDDYYKLIEELNKIKGTTFVDVKNIIPPDEYFIDPIHLNVEGAHIYAANLAKQFVIQKVIVKP